MGFGLQDFFRILKSFAAAPAVTHITSKNMVAYAVSAASKPGEGPSMTTNSSIHTFFFFGKFASLAGFKKILQPLNYREPRKRVKNVHCMKNLP